jgi:hypothetical protein
MHESQSFPPLMCLVGSTPYCTIKAKAEFLKQVEAFDGDRSAFVRQKKADRKAWSEVCDRGLVNSSEAEHFFNSMQLGVKAGRIP